MVKVYFWDPLSNGSAALKNGGNIIFKQCLNCLYSEFQMILAFRDCCTPRPFRRKKNSTTPSHAALRETPSPCLTRVLNPTSHLAFRWPRVNRLRGVSRKPLCDGVADFPLPYYCNSYIYIIYSFFGLVFFFSYQYIILKSLFWSLTNSIHQLSNGTYNLIVKSVIRKFKPV